MNAAEFVEQADWKWHQCFPLGDRVKAPGTNSIETLYSFTDIPEDLSGLSVLDIGTTNGGAAFEAERRGAKQVVAVDIVPPEVYGILEIRDFLGSEIEYIQADLFDLPDPIYLFGEKFDIVLFWGVLYHLRDPLLGLDVVRSLSRDRVYIETQVADWEIPEYMRGEPLVWFYRHNELANDPTNWFAPTIECAEQWLGSAGFTVDRQNAWPRVPQRAMFCTTVARPEWIDYTLEQMPAPYGIPG